MAVVSRGFQLFACLLFRGALFRVEVEVQFRLPQHKTGQSTPKMNAASDTNASSTDGNDGCNNALIISLYLVDSSDDILRGRPTDGSGSKSTNNSCNKDIKKRARLYQRLCKACAIANDVVLRSSSLDDDEGGDDDKRSSSTQSRSNNPQTTRHTHNRPWGSGGDGPIFGIHCDITSDEYFNSMNDVDGDDIWQSQPPTDQSSSATTTTSSTSDQINDILRQNKRRRRTQIDDDFRQPHLRAICRYGNDINDMWRCVDMALRISSKLSSQNLKCAIECWDVNDGHILLIESAEYLPSWVDDDVLQGGVGGPEGCRNRCWIVDGNVHLIPLSDNSQHAPEESVDRLSRRDALCTLVESKNNSEEGESNLVASHSVQEAIQDRINCTDYSSARDRQAGKKELESANREKSHNNSHWHIAAAALPASVARFIERHPSLVPLLVDSFCENAPAYLKERSVDKHRKRSNDSEQSVDDSEKCSDDPSSISIPDSNTPTSATSFGATFPYEQIVIVPIVFARTNYAELVTGRGVVPSFPIPSAYRSVELNRFQRQLRQSAFGSDYYPGNAGDSKRRRNPFERAVDVGIRLSAGLDWIVSTEGGKASDLLKDAALQMEDSAIQSLGEVERRLRIYWSRIDAEASGGFSNESSANEQNLKSTQLPWIEQAWQAGPNGSGMQHAECDKALLQALESMSKCRVFNPELSQPLWKEPCPYTRPGLSLLEITQSGMKCALKWQREEYNEDHFPVPRLWEVDDDDSWMEVNSLEELEEEMRSLSSRKVNGKSEGCKPRRTTRRSRRNLAQSNSGADAVEKSDGQDGNNKLREDAQKVLIGFRSFVTGEGELEGAVTTNETESEFDPEKMMSQEVNINPRKFLNILHSMLKDKKTSASASDINVSPSAIDQDISKFFFDEDLNDDNMSDESECSGTDENCNEDSDNPQLNGNQISTNEDPWCLQNIMVSATKR